MESAGVFSSIIDTGGGRVLIVLPGILVQSSLNLNCLPPHAKPTIYMIQDSQSLWSKGKFPQRETEEKMTQTKQEEGRGKEI